MKKLSFIAAAAGMTLLLACPVFAEEVEEVDNAPQVGYVGTLSGVNVRKTPSLDAEIINTLEVNTEIEYISSYIDEEWDIVFLTDEDGMEYMGYIYDEFVTDEEIEIPKPVVKTSRSYSGGGNCSYVNAPSFKSQGVIYDNGYRYTWYSERVLPGGGLNIPGRHTNSEGYVCDENGYICVASNDLAKGTVVETPGGTGKVYDSGCASGTIDCYVNW